MITHRKIGLLVCLLCLLGPQVFGQQMQTQVATVAGGNATGSGGNASFAIGQVSYTTNASGSGLVKAGIVQLFTNNNPLPISLLQFEASYQPVAGTVLLTWSTASETDNEWFALERSADGIYFEPIGRVAGLGNHQAIAHYRWIDEHPQSGISYYRLKQIDYNGGFSYAPVRSVYIELAKIGVNIYPNPACSHITVDIPSLASNTASYQLVDSSGKLVGEGIILTNKQQIILNQFPTGIYLLRINQVAHPSYTFKIVKT